MMTETKHKELIAAAQQKRGHSMDERNRVINVHTDLRNAALRRQIALGESCTILELKVQIERGNGSISGMKCKAEYVLRAAELWADVEQEIVEAWSKVTALVEETSHSQKAIDHADAYYTHAAKFTETFRPLEVWEWDLVNMAEAIADQHRAQIYRDVLTAWLRPGVASFRDAVRRVALQLVGESHGWSSCPAASLHRDILKETEREWLSRNKWHLYD